MANDGLKSSWAREDVEVPVVLQDAVVTLDAVVALEAVVALVAVLCLRPGTNKASLPSTQVASAGAFNVGRSSSGKILPLSHRHFFNDLLFHRLRLTAASALQHSEHHER